MKFIVSTLTFRNGILRAADAVSPNASLPVLGNLLLEASEGILAITGTNLEQSSRVELACDVSEPGKTTLPCKKLSDIIRAVNSDDVTLEMSKGVAHINAGTSEYKIPGLAADDFPLNLFPEPKESREWKFKASELRQVLVQLAPVQSVEASRYVLCGVFLKSRDKALDWVATNGRALTIITTDNDGGEVSVILPSDFVRQAIGSLDGDESVSLFVSEMSVKMVGKTHTLTSKLIEGNYPSYETFTPKKSVGSVELPREEFLKTVNRLAAVGMNANRLHEVTLAGTKNNLEILVNNGPDDLARDSISVKLDAPFKLRLNKQYIDATLRNMPEDTVRLEYIDSSSPAVFRAGNATSIIQVIRVKE